ncbi:hypothetical protein TEA_021104 [Camellia sinensis var. sinensis]|uniref:Uncharacterized protein n=1 Tax=Camellia sinensis var. sinensis TaxID=542762 RepID=A0A4S4DBI4_CAMSN|nr:hypothetical protein TEA_021104 [Camellia sinensis var. sinensis]
MATLSHHLLLHPTPLSLKHLFLSLSSHKTLLLRPLNPRLFVARLRPRSLSSSAETSQSLTTTFNGDHLVPHHHLSCSMPNQNLKVAVLLSGGVDSSVALRLLHAAGHSCTAFYLKIWFQEDFENFWSECPWEEDLKYAKAVCNQGSSYVVLIYSLASLSIFQVSYIIEEYRCGRTPNPDVLCNTRIKFGAFMDAISGMTFDYVASGHYANIVHSFTDQMDKPSILKLSNDMDEVRYLAKKFDLPNKDRKDSQGICFLGKEEWEKQNQSGRYVKNLISTINYDGRDRRVNLLQDTWGEEGVILEARTGDFLGKHGDLFTRLANAKVCDSLGPDGHEVAVSRSKDDQPGSWAVHSLHEEEHALALA